MADHKIDTVLVTTDFSDTSKKAFGLARQIADAFGARIVLAYVVEDHLPPLMVDYGGYAARVADIMDSHEDHARKQLEELKPALGKDVTTAVTAGIPHLEIITLATKFSADLIVMATHGRGFVSHAILGSTTERVLRRAPCPVLSVRASGDEEEK